MNYFNAFTARPDICGTRPDLQRIILERATGTIKHFPYGSPEINTTLESVANAVESAYILTAKADLPKVEVGPYGCIAVAGTGDMVVPEKTAAFARKRATAWLAIARHLEVQEKAKAYEEAKAKAVKEAMEEAAENARLTRLNELADEWFGKDFDDLGPNKAAAVKEIHRLETQLNAKDAA